MRVLRAWLIPAACLTLLAAAVAEDLSLTTYYPSPRGVYKELRTTGNALLSMNAGGVGIGTNPGMYKLSVNGDVNMNARRITNVATPVSTSPGSDVATKDYVDAQAAGGGCYVSYTGSCVAGFVSKGSVGSWGVCLDATTHRTFFSPPGGGCTIPSYNLFTLYTVGTASVCCQQ